MVDSVKIEIGSPQASLKDSYNEKIIGIAPLTLQGGRYNTEIVFKLLTQQPWVQILAPPCLFTI